MTTTIMVADSEPLFREGLIQLLATQRDFRVVGEAADTVEAVEQAWREQPDLVLLALDLPTAGGQETARRIRHISPDIKVIMLVPPRDDDIRAALAEDVHEVVNCSARGTQILDRIRSVAESARPRRDPPSASATDYPALGPHKLTPREQEVLALIALAWNNHQIERALGIRNSTVKRHVRHILRKLHARNRVQAAVYAYRQPQTPEEGTPP